MKRLNYLSSLLCAMALVGCSNDDFTAENGTVSQPSGDITIEASSGNDTRTTVKDYDVLWSEGDQFYIFGGTLDNTTGYEHKATLALKAGSDNGVGTKVGKFSGALTSGSQDGLQYAIYVKDVSTNFKPIASTLTFPTEYTHPNSSAPMFGVYDKDAKKVAFSQLLCGMIRVQVDDIKTAGKTGSLKLSAQGIVGDATLTNIGTDNKVTVGEITGTAADAVVLNFTTVAGTMLLDIPVPVKNYASGITATLTIDGESTTFSTTENFDVQASQIRIMQAVKVIEVEGETISFQQESSSIQNTNTLLASGVSRIKMTSLGTTEEELSSYQIEVPAGQEADIELPSLAENTAITVTGVETTASSETAQAVARRTVTTRAANSIAKKVILRTPSGSQGSVTLKNIETVELNGAWPEANIDAGCNDVTVKAGAEVTKLTVTAGATVKNVTVETGASVTNYKDETGKVAQNIIALGDVLLSDGTFVKADNITDAQKAQAIGVVAYLYSDAEKETTAKKLLEDGSYFQAKGLVLALNDVDNRYAWSSITEGSPTSTYYCETVVGKAVTESHDGYIYTQRIINRSDLSNFPAFGAITSFRSSNAITATAGSYLNWYMPSIGEWGDILKGLGGLETSTVKSKTSYEDIGYKYEGADQYTTVVNKINGALTKAGATGELLTTTAGTVKYYLSSTEISATDIWVMLFQKNDPYTFIYFYNDGKTAGGDYVRCVLAF